MRLLALVSCLTLSGCFGPVAKYSTNPNSLYSVERGGVNVGSNPQVSEMRVIRGELYIY